MTPMPKTPISQTVVASAAGSWLPGAAGAELSAFFAREAATGHRAESTGAEGQGDGQVRDVHRGVAVGLLTGGWGTLCQDGARCSKRNAQQ